ncbi:MAG TPA: hypothetical protein VIT91_05400 [Chthoniobacterales bacterium]
MSSLSSRVLVVFLVALAGFFNVAGSKKKPAVTVRFHVETSKENGAPFTLHIPRADGQGDLWVSQIPAISEEDMESFLPFQASDGTFGAYFKLDPHGKLMIETLSMEARGKVLAIIVNGRHVIDLLIDRPIRDGLAVIPSGLTTQEVDLLHKKLKITGEKTGKK